MSKRHKVPDSHSLILGVDGLSAEDRQFIEGSVAELSQAFRSLSGVRKGIAILGSARCTPGSPLYEQTLEVTRRIAAAFLARNIHDFAFITGGGPCVMRAGLEGARETATTVGLNIKLPKEQAPNEFQEIAVNFSRFMGLRKYTFAKYASAFVFMSGGYGTLDEFYEILCLMQCGLIPVVPIYLIGKMWKMVDEVHKEELLSQGYIAPDDLKLYQLRDYDSDFAEELVESVLALSQGPAAKAA
jgi:hypothetical protein